MMIEVVKSGTGKAAAISGIEVAGKTGTAQAGAEGTRSLAWFSGFAPAAGPRIAVAVLVEGDEDSSNETGGRIAAPIAKKLIEAHRTAARW
jgi:peptidoglycan glycosyltransferase